MAEQKNNPDKLSADDWALSDSENSVEEDIHTGQQSDVVAQQFDPADTAYSAGRDISLDQDPTGGARPGIPSAEGKPISEHPETMPGSDDFSPGVQIPHHTFEIIKPIAPVITASGNREVEPQSRDGWQMPQPVFRVSDGRLFTSRDPVITGATDAITPTDENVLEIYEPPDELEAAERNSVDLLELDTDTDTSVQPAEDRKSDTKIRVAAAQPPLQPKSGNWKKWVVIVLGALVVGSVVILIAIASFGLFFFRSD